MKRTMIDTDDSKRCAMSSPNPLCQTECHSEAEFSLPTETAEATETTERNEV